MADQAASISGLTGQEASARPFGKASSGAERTRSKQTGSLNADPFPDFSSTTPLIPAACAAWTMPSRPLQSKTPLPGGVSTEAQRTAVARANLAFFSPAARTVV